MLLRIVIFHLPLQSAGSSLLSEQSGTPLQYFDRGMQIPFGHFSSENLHVCFDLVTILLLFVLLPPLLLLDRLLLPFVGIFCSLWCWSSSSDATGDSESGCDDVGKDNAYDIIGFDTNVSRPMSAYSSADTKLGPSIRNCKRKEQNEIRLKIIPFYWLEKSKNLFGGRVSAWNAQRFEPRIKEMSQY